MARGKKATEQVETPVQVESIEEIKETKLNPCDKCALSGTKACLSCEEYHRS